MSKPKPRAHYADGTPRPPRRLWEKNRHSYDWVTNEMFDEELEKVIEEASASTLIAIPGLYEVVREEFNNEILERLERFRPEEE
jgi:hypothetical protein